MANLLLPNFSVIDELGSGGMAVVHRALDERLGREVALKVLHEHIASHSENRDRFEREARAVARLAHPNILQVFEFSPPDATTQYIACELLEGPTLREFVVDGEGVPPHLAAMIALGLAQGLEHAHQHGIIHRDIKPENIMFSLRGTPKLMDFGLARILDSNKLTHTGTILGSPAHMSPESIEGFPITERSDIFAFGTVLYFLFTGTLPFQGSNPAVVLNAILSGDFEAPVFRAPALPDALNDLTTACLSRAPEDRPENMSVVRKCLEDFLARFSLATTGPWLQRLFTERDALIEDLRHRVLAKLRESLASARKESSIAEVISLCDEILALAPDDEDAQATLDSLQRKRRRYRGSALLVSGCSILLLVYTALTLYHDSTMQRESRVRAQLAVEEAHLRAHTRALASAKGLVATLAIPAANGVVAQAESTASGVAAIEASREQARSLAARSASELVERIAAGLEPEAGLPSVQIRPLRPNRRLAGRFRTTPTQLDSRAQLPNTEAGGNDETGSSELGRVALRVYPPAALVRIDGVERGQASSLVNLRELAVGRHLLEAYHEGYPSFGIRETFDVQPGGEVTNLFVEVPWVPAQLRVSASEAGVVWSEGEAIGRTNESIRIELPGRSSSRDMRLTVISESVASEPYVTDLRVESGGEYVIRAIFE